MSKKPASLTSDLLARKGDAEPSSIDPAARMTPSAGPDFPPYGSGGFGGHEGGRPRPPEPEIIYTAEETSSGGGNARLIVGAVLAVIVIGGIILTLSSRTDRGVAPVSPDITATRQQPAPEQAPAASTAPSTPAAPETLATAPTAPQPESAPAEAAAPQAAEPGPAPQAAAPAPQTATVPAPSEPAAPAVAAAPEQAPEQAPAPAAEAAAPAEAPVAAKPASKGAYVIQLQALRDEKSARASWAHLTKRHAALSGHALDIEKADLGDKGVWYRVRAAGFATKSAAAGACAKLKSAGQDCIVRKR